MARKGKQYELLNIVFVFSKCCIILVHEKKNDEDVSWRKSKCHICRKKLMKMISQTSIHDAI